MTNEKIDVALEDAREGDWAEFEYAVSGSPSKRVKAAGEVYFSGGTMPCAAGNPLAASWVRNVKITRTVPPMPPLPTEEGTRIIVTHFCGEELTWPFIARRWTRSNSIDYFWESEQDYLRESDITGWVPFP